MHEPLSQPTLAAAERAIARPAKLLRLDAVRGLAVLCIFVFHLAGNAAGWQAIGWVDGHRHFDLWPGRTDWLLYPVVLGFVGVPIFFVLSGFVIHLGHRAYARDGVGAFYRRRFWRIYPPYLLAMLAIWAVGRRSGEHVGVQLLTHALLIHNVHPLTFEGINSSFWSIACESQFYLAYPLFILARNRWGIGRTVVALGIVNLVGRVAMTILWTGMHRVSNEWAFVILRSPIILWFDWALGAYVAECFGAGRRAFAPRVATVGIVACALACVGTTFLKSTEEYGLTFASFAAAFAIDAIAHGRAEPRWYERLLVPVGLVGYSFYLIHQPMIGELSRRFARVGIHGPLAPLGWAMTFGVIFVASWLLYRFVERPSQSIGRPRSPKVEALTPA